VIFLSLNRINHNFPKGLMLIRKRRALPFTNPVTMIHFLLPQDVAVGSATNRILKVDLHLSRVETELLHHVINVTEKTGMMTKRLILPLVILIAIFATGCATVQPWEKGLLGDPIMLIDSNPLEKGLIEHHIDYREGAVGGTGAQSGGCGCG